MGSGSERDRGEGTAETLDRPAMARAPEGATADGPTLDRPPTPETAPDRPAPRAIAEAETLPPPPPVRTDAGPEPRYKLIKEIGRGGMGTVELVDDTRLGRRIAVKRQLAERTEAKHTLRFMEEARATAQLEHPNIVPLYDLDASGPFFTMRFVEGRSLGDALDAARRGERLFGPAELLLVFMKVCDAVAYAHSRGVLHRDLKPDNIMLGRFGEVFVMDWGLARVRESDARPYDAPGDGGPSTGERRVQSVRDSIPGKTLTQVGTILGTPGYMAPEQVRGAPADGRSDLFALGAILYEIVSGGDRPIEGRTMTQLLANTMLADIKPPKNASPGMQVIVLKALARAPVDRWQTVTELRDAVAEEIEGAREAARRREEARKKLAAADAHLAKFRALLAQSDEIALDAQRRRDALPKGFDDHAVLEPIWQEQQRSRDAASDARRAFWDAYGALVGAAHDDPSWDEAKDSLVGLLVGRAKELRGQGEKDSAGDLIALARQHDAARVEALVDAPGTLVLATDPPGAHVRVLRCVEQGPLLVEREVGERGPTPCELTLAPGEYVLELRAEGREQVRASIVLDAHEREERDVWIPPPGALAPGMVYVPGGKYWIRGDTLQRPPPKPRLVELAPFGIGRHDVTMEEYAEFLNALPPEEAAKHAPRIGGVVYWKPESDGVYRVPWTDPEGDVIHAQLPVICVSALDGDAYASWRGMRLPTSDEWEVAARGGGDRAFPWGDGFDPALCWMINSFPGASTPVAVQTKAADLSVFGAYDMAGLARNWTATRDPQTGEGVTRGGAWQALAEQCRVGTSRGLEPGHPYVTTSLRVAQSLRGWSAR